MKVYFAVAKSKTAQAIETEKGTLFGNPSASGLIANCRSREEAISHLGESVLGQIVQDEATGFRKMKAGNQEHTNILVKEVDTETGEVLVYGEFKRELGKRVYDWTVPERKLRAGQAAEAAPADAGDAAVS